MISATKLEEAFPEVNPGIKPLGARILVQLRTTRSTTASGIQIVRDTQKFNDESGQFAKIISLGPLAFCNRNSGEKWPEGIWANVGDIVRVAKYGGDRFCKEVDGNDVIFVIFDDHSITAIIDQGSLESLDELR